jgi:DNA-binding CsgD family transcriptional regulator
MGSTIDFDAVVEAAFSMQPCTDAWIRRIAKLALRADPGCSGALAYEVDASRRDEPVVLRSVAAVGGSAKLRSLLLRDIRQLTGESYRTLVTTAGGTGVAMTVIGEARVLSVLEPDGHGIGVARLGPADTAFPMERDADWLEAGVHLAAGYRLHRLIGRADCDGRDGRSEIGARTVANRDVSRKDLWNELLDGRWQLFEQTVGSETGYMVLVQAATGSHDARKLSPRERDVVALAVRGLANKEIAYELHLSIASVATYLRRALVKLSLRTRLELVQLAEALSVWGYPCD